MIFKAAILEFIKKPLIVDFINSEELLNGQVLVKINETIK